VHRGFGCALPAFPGVYGRVSDQIEWIKSTICQISSNPPADFDCANIYPPVLVPGDGRVSVPVTIIIQFDDFPEEISWSITEKEAGNVLVEVPAGAYNGDRSRVQETVFLPAGSTFVFSIEDNFGDGLCCNSPGNYMVILGRSPNGEVLVSGGGDFGHRQTNEFVVPAEFDDETEDEPIIDEGQIPLTIVIQMDNYPQEIGWRVDRLGIEVEEVIRVPAGIYTMPQTLVVRTIVLEEGELYYFRVYDVLEDGIDNGYGMCIELLSCFVFALVSHHGLWRV
jgi:hypothetical protein